MKTAPEVAIPGSRTLVYLFLIAICIPGTAQLLGSSSSSPEAIEKRRAAPFPSIEFGWNRRDSVPTTHRWDTFPKRFEAYFNDHLGLRRPLIRGYNRAKHYGLFPAINWSANLNRVTDDAKRRSMVLVGHEGWLYFYPNGDTSQFLGKELFSTEELERFRDRYVALQAEYAQRGIRYVLMIAPDKETIYPEFLPSWMHLPKTSRLDQVLDFLLQESQLEILDLRGPLRKAKGLFPTYFRTDSHWNDFGAFIAYQQVMKKVAQFFPAARPDELADYDISVYDSSESYGATDVESSESKDLQIILGVPVSDTIVELTRRRPRLARYLGDPPVSGTTALGTTQNSKAELGRAVVIHDSFFRPVLPYFSEHWQQVIYSTSDISPESLEENPPDLVLEEFVERKL